MSIKWKTFGRTLAIATAVIALAWCVPFSLSLAGYRFFVNTTNSVPVGIYVVHVGTIPQERGGFITFYPPEAAARTLYGRGWLAPGAPLTKQVAGLPGDIYCVDSSGIRVRGVMLGPVYQHDRTGFELPHLSGCTAVPPGHVLPLGLNAPNSYDGRYFGAINDRLVLGEARLLMRLPRG